MADLHNVFISHYSGDVQRTRELQERLAANGCIVRNSAAKEDEGGIIRNTKGKQVSDAVIARYLKMRINWAGTFIVIIGEHTHERAWVNYEIEQANKMGKRIVGIYNYGCKEKVPLPGAFEKYGNTLIGWNSLDKLSNVINGGNVPFENFDSSPATAGSYPMIYIKCN